MAATGISAPSYRRFRVTFAAIAIALMAIPAVGMLFSGEVNWGPGDFLAMGVLLAGLGVALELALRFTTSRALRATAIALALASFLFVWAMLAVGLD